MSNTLTPLTELTLDQPDYLDVLFQLVHSSECLLSKGYVLSRLSDDHLEKKQ
ncbi:hypothetical protein QL093DRAFT_2371214 [Fusarium oxysporum]|nr:hypothetical protein QL093DRAFT_2371214 [Fusarium oxysporum]